MLYVVASVEELSHEELAEALCAASDPFYAELWRLMVAHGLRVTEALSLRVEDIANGYLTVQRLKGSQRHRHIG